MGVPLVQEYRQAGVPGDLELPPEGLELRLAGREIPEIVEPALADGDDRVVGCQLADQRIAVVRVVRRMVRMHAGCRVQHAGMGMRQLRGPHVARVAAARDDHATHAGRCRALHHLVAIVVETVMRQVGADVGQLAGHGFSTVPNERVWRQ